MAPKRTKEGVIISNRKKAAQQMRNTSRLNSDGSRSTHVMEWGTGSGKYKYQVNPTIFPTKPKSKTQSKKSSWTDLGNTPGAAYKEAMNRGEVIGFKSKKRAERFAAGSWKTGQAKKEAMSAYRKSKRNKS